LVETPIDPFICRHLSLLTNQHTTGLAKCPRCVWTYAYVYKTTYNA